MSEVLSVKLTNREKETFEPAMPAGYEVFDRIETTTDENGEPSRTNGILIIGGGDNQYERKVQLDLDKDWAIDLEERKSYLADPEAWEKERRLETLAKQVEDLIAQNSKLEKRVAGLEAELSKRTQSQEPVSAIDKPEKPPEPSIEPKPEEPKESEQPSFPEPAGEEPGEPEDNRNFFQRLRDRYITSKNQAATILVRKKYEYDDQGRVVVVEEEREGEKKSSKFWPGVAVGALAVGAAWLLSNNGDDGGLNGLRNEIQQDFNDFREKVLADLDIDGDGDFDTDDFDHEHDNDEGLAPEGDNTDDSGNDRAGDHVDSFGVAGGNGRSIVELPKDLTVGGSEGQWYLLDTQSDTRVVEMGVNVTDIQDQQGNLSTEARSILEDKGYDLTQKKKHYLDGSGIRRWHYFTDVSR